MSVSLYRKYRPQDFKSVYGQTAAVKIILNSISKSKIGHAYLFSGSRGCGKTSVARIFAKALNCLNPQNFEPCCKCKNCLDITSGNSLDVIEIDGASNNGVDEIRELKTHVTLAPFNSRYKIYIIDEVHMLSAAAFNALLKTLEEPPAYVVFILATTEPHKVPVTIRSRCQHIPFHSISPEDIFKRLNEVCKLENVKAENAALWEIARQADGALRDALSLLEQVIAAGDVNLKNIEDMLGAGSRPEFERYITQIRSDLSNAYTGIKKMLEAGAAPLRIFEELFALVRDLWLAARYPVMIDTLGITEDDKDFLRGESKEWPVEKLRRLLEVLVKILAQAKSGIRQDILAGLFVYELDNLDNNNRNANVANVPEQRRFQNAQQNFQIQTQNQPQPQAQIQTQNPQKLQPLFANKNAPVNSEVQDNPQPLFSENDYDQNLTAQILNTVHEKNIMLYCGLLGSHAFKRDDKLNIVFDEIYPFEALITPQNQNTIAKVLADFNKICLYFGSRNVEINCQRQNENSVTNIVNQYVRPQPKIKSKNENTQVEFVSEGENVNYDSSIRNRNTSKLDEIFNGLRRLNVKAEIVMRYQNNTDSENDNGDEEEDNSGTNSNDMNNLNNLEEDE